MTERLRLHSENTGESGMTGTTVDLTRTQRDPAKSAAAMLMRLGFSIFALVIPSSALLSRWVIVVLVPIGAVLIILSALMREFPDQLWKKAVAALGSDAGLVAVLIAAWAAASLAWAPMPGEAAQKLFKSLGVIVLGFLAVMALPARMRATNLHLVTLGAVLGALLLLIAGISLQAGSPLLVFPSATPGRVAVLLTVIMWVAAAWLAIKNRLGLAIGVLALVVAAVMFGTTGEAVIPLVVGVFIAGSAWQTPERAGKIIGFLAGALVLGWPFWAALAGMLPDSLGAGYSRWWGLGMADPIRFLTGHGFDSGGFARLAGYIPPDTRGGVIAELWFELGLIGALGLAMALRAVFAGAGKLGLELGPSALAALSAAFVFALLERGAAQTWWLNGMVVFAIMLMSVERGRYRTVRPRAQVTTDKTEA